jgi:mercuric ion transport protein
VSAPLSHAPAPATPAKTARTGGIAAGAILLACAAACSLPLIIGAGALSGIGAFLAGGQIIGIVLIAVAVAATGWWFLRRAAKKRRTAHTAADAQAGEATSCDCGAAC